MNSQKIQYGVESTEIREARGQGKSVGHKILARGRDRAYLQVQRRRYMGTSRPQSVLGEGNAKI